jgi:hypothetical protein
LAQFFPACAVGKQAFFGIEEYCNCCACGSRSPTQQRRSSLVHAGGHGARARGRQPECIQVPNATRCDKQFPDGDSSVTALSQQQPSIISDGRPALGRPPLFSAHNETAVDGESGPSAESESDFCPTFNESISMINIFKHPPRVGLGLKLTRDLKVNSGNPT